ncbi:hypothetical protein ACRAWD_07865 [Caulobacter segnis]
MTGGMAFVLDQHERFLGRTSTPKASSCSAWPRPTGKACCAH